MESFVWKFFTERFFMEWRRIKPSSLSSSGLRLVVEQGRRCGTGPTLFKVGCVLDTPDPVLLGNESEYFFYLDLVTYHGLRVWSLGRGQVQDNESR